MSMGIAKYTTGTVKNPMVWVPEIAYEAAETRIRELEARQTDYSETVSSLAAKSTAYLARIRELEGALRPIVETATDHPAKANFVAVHRQLIGAARDVLGSPLSDKDE